MHELLARSTRVMVMTERGRTILEEVYQTPPDKIDLIPHGIPDVTFVAPDHYKRQFGVGGNRVLPASDVRKDLKNRLVSIFDKVAGPGWTWFEDGLTYNNATLAHALIVSGRATGQTRVYERGIQALRWLVGVQTSMHGHLRPIGSNGFYKRNGVRADFDQQPIEAQSTVSACLEAYRATADLWWYEQAQRAFDWFLGWNDLGLELYAPETGGCRDGLHSDRSNESQGAESMLAFLLSLAEMRLIQNTANGIQRAGMAAPINQ